MSTSVQRIVESFELLTEEQKREAAIEILRRLAQGEGDLPDAAFVAVAEELFLALDMEEEKGAKR